MTDPRRVNFFEEKKLIELLTSTRFFVTSNILRFLVVAFLQIDSCFSIRSSLKLRPQMLHATIPSGGGPAVIV